MRPILFTIPEWVPGIGGVPVFSYGLLLGLAFILGWYLTAWLARKDALEPGKTSTVMLVGIACALVGGRALGFAASPESWRGWGSLLEFESGGFAAYGGFLGFTLGAVVALRIVRLPFFRFMDHCAPAMALGLALARVGCFLYGCDFGKRMEGGVRFPHWGVELLPWVGEPCQMGRTVCGPLTQCAPELAACVGSGSPAWVFHRYLGYAEPGSLYSAAVVPVQLIASANGLLLFFVALVVHRYRRFQGQVLLVFAGWYAVTRFFLETLREDPGRGVVWTTDDPGWLATVLVEQVSLAPQQLQTTWVLTSSQLVSCLLLLAVGAALVIVVRHRRDPGRWTPGGLGSRAPARPDSDVAGQVPSQPEC